MLFMLKGAESLMKGSCANPKPGITFPAASLGLAPTIMILPELEVLEDRATYKFPQD